MGDLFDDTFDDTFEAYLSQVMDDSPTQHQDQHGTHFQHQDHYGSHFQSEPQIVSNAIPLMHGFGGQPTVANPVSNAFVSVATPLQPKASNHQTATPASKKGWTPGTKVRQESDDKRRCLLGKDTPFFNVAVYIALKCFVVRPVPTWHHALHHLHPHPLTYPSPTSSLTPGASKNQWS